MQRLQRIFSRCPSSNGTIPEEENRISPMESCITLFLGRPSLVSERRGALPGGLK